MTTAGGDFFNRAPWAVSLHGGHSGQYCDHGKGALRDIAAAAVRRGYSVFGMSEHAPRYREEDLYPEELAMGWDLDKVQRDFEDYARESAELVQEYEAKNDPSFCLLRGFEAEVTPPGKYGRLMNELRHTHGFDYVVGSAHWVYGMITDHSKPKYDEAAEACGGPENLAVRYYEQVAEMVEAVRPEVVGHIDVIRKFATPAEAVETPRARDAARAALEVIRKYGCILDINTAGLRKGMGSPYPSPWLLRMAAVEMGIGVCFGDDSHSPQEAGEGIIETRRYLLDNGVGHITFLERDDGKIVRRTAPLEP